MAKITRFGSIVSTLWLAWRCRKHGARSRYELLQRLIDMGGLYVKFVQALLLKLSDDKQFASYDYSYLLKKAYDSTPFEPLEIKTLLKTELGELVNEIVEVTAQPVAAGSFGQVYKAQLQDGSVVIVKVVRPSVIQNINFDMKVLQILSWVVDKGYQGPIDTKHIFRSFKDITLKELDYLREADYADELYHRYYDHPSLVIPKTYLELCTSHIIVQEFIDGLALTDVLTQKELGVDPEEYVRQQTGSDLTYQAITVGQIMLESIILEGSAHGDPHPGNIIVLPDNKVALIDFGIRTSSPSNKQAFFALVKQYQKIYTGQFDVRAYTWAIVEMFVQDLTMAVRSIDRYNHGRLSNQIFEAISEAAVSIYAGSGQNVEDLIDNQKFLKVFNTVINEDNRFGFQIEVEQPEFMRATLMFISLTQALGIKQKTLAAIYTNVVNTCEGVSLEAHTRYTTPENAVEIIAQWLEQIASKDIYLYHLITANLSPRLLRV